MRWSLPVIGYLYFNDNFFANLKNLHVAWSNGNVGSQLSFGGVSGGIREVFHRVRGTLGFGNRTHNISVLSAYGSGSGKRGIGRDPGSLIRSPEENTLNAADERKYPSEDREVVGISRYQLISGLAMAEFLNAPVGGFIIGFTITAAILCMAAFIGHIPSKDKPRHKAEKSNDTKEPLTGR
jgi:hypothetical protein